MSDVIPEVATEMLQAFADAWNRHDVDALMSFMTEDCVFEASAGSDVCGTRYVGRDSVRAAFAEVWAPWTFLLPQVNGIADDVTAVRAVVETAYAPYVPRIGREPAPMTADARNSMVSTPDWRRIAPTSWRLRKWGESSGSLSSPRPPR